MDDKFDIQAYMTSGVERIVADSLKATLRNPRQSAFMVKFATVSRKAAKIRAEPCPFSPYSDINVRETSLRSALKSKLFLALQEGDMLKDSHNGGCVLYEKRKQVEDLLQENYDGGLRP